MFAPSKLLPITITGIVATDVWSEDDGTGDPWIGYPYRWEVTFEIAPQQHSAHLTRLAFYYDGMDVSVGDWVSDVASGLAVRIEGIVSQNASTVVAVCEDIDRYNTFTDPSGQGNGIGFMGQGFLFQTSDDGLPILSPMSAFSSALQANLAWQLDQISRFRHRNLIQSYYRVQQNGHTLVIGDVIRLGSNGLYVKVIPGSSTVQTVVGAVTSVGVPGPSWFSYRPVGRVVTDITPSLPGNPGNLIYLDQSGGFTNVRPSVWAKPIYIRLENGSTGIIIDRSIESYGSNGYNSQVHVVADLVARDALTGVNPGDQALVEDGGNGEWRQFVRGGDNLWHLLVTQDASDTDAETIEIEITVASDLTDVIHRISEGSRVTFVTVNVIEPFAPDASLTVGDPDDTESLMTNDYVDLGSVGTYSATPARTYTGNGDVDIVYVFDPASSTTGRAKVAITYS